MRKLVALTLIAGALIGTSTAQAHESKAQLRAEKKSLDKSIRHDYYTIQWYRAKGNWWYIGPARALIGGSVLAKHEKHIRWAIKRRTKVVAQLASLSFPFHYSAWMCIHRGEGSWTDSGAPYYGGLQMDYGFMRTYGRWLLKHKGTADHWTPLEQMWVAERAYRSGRGFYPWPNTARKCGLI